MILDTWNKINIAKQIQLFSEGSEGQDFVKIVWYTRKFVKYFRDFITQAAPREIKYFELQFYDDEEFDNKNFMFKFPISAIKVLPRVTYQIQISSFRISRKLLQHIINSSSRSKVLTFDDCEIETKKLKLRKDIEFEIYNLSLESWAREKEKEFELFQNLFRAIKKSSLYKSLEIIQIDPVDMTLRECKRLKKEFGWNFSLNGEDDHVLTFDRYF